MATAANKPLESEEEARGGHAEFGYDRSYSTPHTANQLPGASSASAGVVLVPELSAILCVKSARQTQQRCHACQSPFLPTRSNFLLRPMA